MGRFDGKVAIVTGAASGIGSATALRFAREGGSVAGFDIQLPQPESWKSIEEAAPAASFHTVDVSAEDEVKRAMAEAIDQHGGIDVLVNAAGVAGGGPLHITEEAEWDRVLGVNLNYYEIGDGPTETDVPLLGKLAGEFSKREAIGLDFTFRWLR